jgi:quinoprotein glucose dehydrogenase
VGQIKNAKTVLAMVQDVKLKDSVRLAALQTLSEWSNPPVVDPTIGLHRPYSKSRVLDITSVLETYVKDNLLSAKGLYLSKILNIMINYKISIDRTPLVKLAKSQKTSSSERIFVIDFLLSKKSTENESMLLELLKDRRQEIRISALKHLGQLSPEKAMTAIKTLLASKDSVANLQQVIEILGNTQSPAAAVLIESKIQTLMSATAGDIPLGLHLDYQIAAETRSEGNVKKALASYKIKLSKNKTSQELLHGGNVGNGRALFYNKGSAMCTTCHKALRRRKGGTVGPGLSSVGRRHNKEYLLESLIKPSAVVVPGYGIALVTLKDGSTLGGSVISENKKELSLKLPDGKVKKVAISNVKVRTKATSNMPPMTGILTKKEIRDMVEFLASLKAK